MSEAYGDGCPRCGNGGYVSTRRHYEDQAKLALFEEMKFMIVCLIVAVQDLDGYIRTSIPNNQQRRAAQKAEEQARALLARLPKE